MKDQLQTIRADLSNLMHLGAVQRVIDTVAQLEAMVGEQKPVAWQRRMRPTWGNGNAPWGPWEECSQGQAKDCWRTPLLHDWAYEARALFTAPPAQQPHECTRSHPHENMDGYCVLRTEIARLTNENARLQAQQPQAQAAAAKVTEAMVLCGARELCRLHAGQCQVNEADAWGIYADQFKADARAMLHAAIAAPQQAEAVPSDVVRDAMVKAACDAVAAALGDAYDCTRVWEAWKYGTMGQDDFYLVSEDSDRVREIAVAAIDAAMAQGEKP